MNEVTAPQHEKVLQELGRSVYMVRLIVAFGIVSLFYGVLLVSTIISMVKVTNSQSSLNYFVSYAALFSELMKSAIVMIVILAVVLIVRLIPFIGSILLYQRCKNQLSASSMVPVFTLYQIFGVIEAAAWIALVVYDIINMIRLGVSFPVNAGSMYYMVLVIAVLTIICKIWQGIALTKFLHGLKRSIRSEKVKKGAIGGIKFASIMLTLSHAILLAALVINLLIALGIGDFFRTFQYLWMVYLFFISYIFSNSFLSALLTMYDKRMILEMVGVPTRPGYSASYRAVSGAANNYNPYQIHGASSNQPYNQGYGQSVPNQPYNQGYGQPVPNQPYNQGYGQPVPNQPYNQGHGQPVPNQPYNQGYGQSVPNQPYNQGYGQGYGQRPQSVPMEAGYGQQPQSVPMNAGYGERPQSVPMEAGYGQQPQNVPYGQPDNMSGSDNSDPYDPYGDMFTFHNTRR